MPFVGANAVSYQTIGSLRVTDFVWFDSGDTVRVSLVTGDIGMTQPFINTTINISGK